MSFLFKDKKELLYVIKQWKFQLSITILVIISIALFLIYSKLDEDTNDTKPIVTSHVNSNQKGKNHDVLKNDDKTNNKIESNTIQNGDEIVFVDIKGAVEHPNVYKMKSSDRIKDVLDKVKLLTDADLSQVNLSEKLTDQKMIYIPSANENKNRITQNDDNNKSGHSKSLNSSSTNKMNINTASETELLKIPGVGPTKVREIIDYRQKNNTFHSIEDLKNIKGIGDKTYERIKEYVTT